ncbi:MAG TPA: DUF3524 domain-containing protein, partial [Planctomycetota bacterium]|nr:DUF3524 domain-containing protein [Planctomycetota bacterium]
MSAKLHVLAIEPYFGLSHRMFLEGYARYSRHEIVLWDLPPRKWKWRMRGSAYHFAARARQEPPARVDIVFASDFLNLADWRALAPGELGRRPSVLYFHENQLGYPLSQDAPVDFHYGWINLSSALAADRVLFNSAYHREEFLREVERVLGLMPDHVPLDLVPSLRERSGVFPVGIDFAPHEEVVASRRGWRSKAPVILWNHRWEYDKAPERFVDALIELDRRGAAFEVAVCGESFGKVHPAFERLEAELSPRIRHLGFIESADDYRRLVADSDIVVSTARHEYFGVSVVEAMVLGCLPVLPAKLSYPEIVPPHLHPLFLYRDESELPDFLERFLAEPPTYFADEVRAAVGRFHWRHLAPVLDDHLEAIASGAHPKP